MQPSNNSNNSNKSNKSNNFGVHLQNNKYVLVADLPEIKQNTTDIANIISDISTNKTDISGIKIDIANNTRDIATNKTDIATNKTDIATNKTDIATNKTDIATNKTGIATNKNDITTNKNDISGIKIDIATNIKTDISGINIEMTELQNTLRTLQSIVSLQLGIDPSSPNTIYIPVILIKWKGTDASGTLDFRDNKLNFGKDSGYTRYGRFSDVYDLLNKTGYNYPGIDAQEQPTGSVKDYFSAISHGKLKIEFVILNASTNINLPIDILDILALGNTNQLTLDDYAYTINGNYIDYGETNDTNGSKLKPELSLAYLKAKDNYNNIKLPYIDDNIDNFDFKFGNFKKNIVYIQAGYGAETNIPKKNNYVWSNKWSFPINGETINYSINPYKKNNSSGTDPRIIPIGVIVHETLHAFGLPDLYDTDFSSKGAGYLSIMASGSWGTNSYTPWLPSYANTWTRNQLSYYFHTNIIEITQDSTNLDLELPPISDTNISYKLQHPTKDDYWLVEYRTKTNFDKMMPCEGLVIWHISNRSDNKSEFPPNRRGESGYKVGLEQKDGLFELERKKQTNDYICDAWVPGEEFTPYGVPSTVSIDGTPSGIKLYDIEKNNTNNRMKFKVKFDTPTPITAKIESINYSFDTNANLDHIPTLKHSDISSPNKQDSSGNHWIEINTSGVNTSKVTTTDVSGSKKITIKVNDNDLISSIKKVTDNSITFIIDKSILESIPKSQGSDKSSFNIVSIKIDGLFSWNDCLKKVD